MEKLKQKLSGAGYRMTAPRMAVLDGLSGLCSPISARALHGKIKKIDRASVYRALNLFEELFIVNVDVVKKEKLYCLAIMPHHHIICRECGYIEKVECNHVFSKFKNFINVRHQLTLIGTCSKCKKYE